MAMDPSNDVPMNDSMKRGIDDTLGRVRDGAPERANEPGTVTADADNDGELAPNFN